MVLPSAEDRPISMQYHHKDVLGTVQELFYTAHLVGGLLEKTNFELEMLGPFVDFKELYDVLRTLNTRCL